MIANQVPIVIGINELKSVSKEWNPDVIHIHNHGITPDIQKLVYNLFPESYLCEQNVFGVPSGYERLDCSFQLAQWSKWNLINRNLRPAYRIEILPNPINSRNFYPISLKERNEFRRRYNIPLDAQVLLRIGQPIKAKWNIRLVDLYIDLHKKYANLVLLCVGAPQNIIDYAKCKASRLNIIFIDKLLNDDDLRECYASCDLFLHLARIGESFGIVLTEAMLCGLPVITINTPYCDNSQSEVVGHMQGGLVANRYSGLIKAVNLLFDNKQLYHQIQISARKYALQRYSLETVISSFLTLMSSKESNRSVKYTLNTKMVEAYLSDAIDDPIPLSSWIYKMKKVCLYFLSERIYRYIFRCYCRLFDKSVQL